MQTAISSIPTLSFRPCLPQPSTSSSSGSSQNNHRVEREIDRRTLLEIAPGREELVASNRGIEEIRHSLKLRIGHDTRHWIYSSRTRRDVSTESLADSSSHPLSEDAFAALGYNRNPEPTNNAVDPSVRRLASSNSIRLRDAGSPIVLDVWGNPVLSTDDRCVSPRPLGPTHILLVCALSSQGLAVAPRKYNPSRSVEQAKRDHDGSSKSPTPPLTTSTSNPLITKLGGVIPLLLELPINDLLFILNAPNILPCTPHYNDESSNLPLPRRLHQQLPYVLIQVPKLETFKELVVYLHNKNQAELFRAIIPEWIRDILHPLPRLDMYKGAPKRGHGSISGGTSLSSSRSSSYSSLQSLPRLFGLPNSASSSSTLLSTKFSPFSLFSSSRPITPPPFKPSAHTSFTAVSASISNAQHRRTHPFASSIPSHSTSHISFASSPRSVSSASADASSSENPDPTSKTRFMPSYLFRKRGIYASDIGLGRSGSISSSNGLALSRLLARRKTLSSTISSQSSSMSSIMERTVDLVAQEIAQTAGSLHDTPRPFISGASGRTRLTSIASEDICSLSDNNGHGSITPAVSPPCSPDSVIGPRSWSRASGNLIQSALPFHPRSPTPTTSSTNHPTDPIIHTASLLDALRDNLDYIGYYDPMLWHELEVSREVLIQAVLWEAKIEGD